ncbi:hypothetical protein [Candidatus Odyssella thessalonicensis]|uniref:hypothetical protein n=1 Tax=Candidatus Odyssella thessalonicensis TaxID=84647 RepID=UPI000225A8CB|nr:hypothetical protein [Candidatus Odyssella thessalonicensis]
MNINPLKALRIFTGIALLNVSFISSPICAQDSYPLCPDVSNALYKQSVEKNLSDIELFTDGQDHYILQTRDRKIFWGDGLKFYPLKSLGENSSWTKGKGIKQKIHFEDPRAPEKAMLLRQGNTIKVADYARDYTLISNPAEVEVLMYGAQFISLPKVRQKEYLLKFTDRDEYIFVDSLDNEEDYYNSFRLFKGSLGAMVQLDLPAEEPDSFPRVLRSRDGGTTYIYLSDGSQLYVPSVSRIRLLAGEPYWQVEEPYWQDSNKNKWPLKELKTDNFDYRRLGLPDFPSENKVLHTPLDLVFGTSSN